MMDAEVFRAWITSAAQVIEANRDHLTQLDAAIGDADHGINLARGFTAVLDALDAQNRGAAASLTPGKILAVTGRTIISKVGGAAGPSCASLCDRAFFVACARSACTSASEGAAEVLLAGAAGATFRCGSGRLTCAVCSVCSCCRRSTMPIANIATKLMAPAAVNQGAVSHRDQPDDPVAREAAAALGGVWRMTAAARMRARVAGLGRSSSSEWASRKAWAARSGLWLLFIVPARPSVVRAIWRRRSGSGSSRSRARTLQSHRSARA